MQASTAPLASSTATLMSRATTTAPLITTTASLPPLQPQTVVLMLTAPAQNELAFALTAVANQRQ